MTNKFFNPDVWGPHYWFVLHTIALSYPDNVNSITKRKYYDLINNLSLFIPDANIGNIFNKFLDSYPVLPYLDSKESFTKWVHFIHNKINIYLGKPEVSYYKALNNYYNNYNLKQIKKVKERNFKHVYIFASVIIVLIILIIYLYYNKL